MNSNNISEVHLSIITIRLISEHNIILIQINNTNNAATDTPQQSGP